MEVGSRWSWLFRPQNRRWDAYTPLQKHNQIQEYKNDQRFLSALHLHLPSLAVRNRPLAFEKHPRPPSAALQPQLLLAQLFQPPPVPLR